MSMLITRKSDRFAAPLGSRAVHWYHNPKFYDVPRDKFEWDTRKDKEFGHGRITDHDRQPQYYFELNKGRGWLSAAFDMRHWKMTKDWYSNLGRDRLARNRRFRKLDTLDFLEKLNERYVWLPDDADGAIGYVSEEDDDPIADSPEFGLSYEEATPDYRDRVLKDRCNGRPTFEWQIPFGQHIIHGYNEVLTAVDVIGNDEAMKNNTYRWKEGNFGTSGLQLQNLDNEKKIVIAEMGAGMDIMDDFKPDTVFVPFGADKSLTSIHSTYAPTSKDDKKGCMVLGLYSLCWFLSPFFPLGTVGSLTAGGLAGANVYASLRTFNNAEDRPVKKLMKKIRDANIDTVVMGDWLNEDYDERIFHTSVNDRAVTERITSGETSIVLAAETRQKIWSDPHKSPGVKTLKYLASGAPAIQHLSTNLAHLIPSWDTPPEVKGDKLFSPNFPSSYRDAINLKRTDVWAHVVNNCPGDKILVCIRDIDNIPSSLVSEVLRRKLSSDSLDVGAAGSSSLPASRVDKVPFMFDDAYDRVEVVF